MEIRDFLFMLLLSLNALIISISLAFLNNEPAVFIPISISIYVIIGSFRLYISKQIKQVEKDR